jgi:hypothetical protein
MWFGSQITGWHVVGIPVGVIDIGPPLPHRAVGHRNRSAQRVYLHTAVLEADGAAAEIGQSQVLLDIGHEGEGVAVEVKESAAFQQQGALQEAAPVAQLESGDVLVAQLVVADGVEEQVLDLLEARLALDALDVDGGFEEGRLAEGPAEGQAQQLPLG